MFGVDNVDEDGNVVVSSASVGVGTVSVLFIAPSESGSNVTGTVADSVDVSVCANVTTVAEAKTSSGSSR